MVSAALVAQREVDEEAAMAAKPADGKPKIPRQGLVPARQGPSRV